MKLSPTLKTFLDESAQTDSYWVEVAKLEFSLSLEKQRAAKKMSLGAIAKKIGTSAAYISKIFRGDSNMTIETMVKLARATGGHLDIKVADNTSSVAQWDMSTIPTATEAATHTTRQSATLISFADYAANSDNYAWERIAA